MIFHGQARKQFLFLITWAARMCAIFLNVIQCSLVFKKIVFEQKGATHIEPTHRHCLCVSFAKQVPKLWGMLS